MKEPTSVVIYTAAGTRPLSVWDRTIQLAHDRNQPLWSDDAVSRVLAREAGVPAFCTLDLIQVFTGQGRLTAAHLQRSHQCLLERGIADVQLSAATLRAAAVVDDWQTGYAGAALARPEAWTTPAKTIQTWIGFIRSVPRASHQRLPSWTYVATLGAARAPYVLGPVAARAIVAQLISAVVFVAAAAPAVVANCVVGCAEAIKATKVEITDPLPLAVQALRDTLGDQLPPEQVTPYLLGAFSECSETVKSTVRRSLLQ